MTWLIIGGALLAYFLVFGFGVFCGIQYAKVPVNDRLKELNAMADSAFREAESAKAQAASKAVRHDPNGVRQRGLIVPAKKKIITL